MEKILAGLFDYQRFEGRGSLRRVIDAVHSREGTRGLSLDHMEWIAAAGEPHQNAGPLKANTGK